MRRTLGVAAATVVTLAALAVWAATSIRTEAASKTLGHTAIAIQGEPFELMETAGNLPTEQFDPF
jgi:hypothetical protein